MLKDMKTFVKGAYKTGMQVVMSVPDIEKKARCGLRAPGQGGGREGARDLTPEMRGENREAFLPVALISLG